MVTRMRGCLSFLVFVVLLVAALVWFAVPPLADLLVTQALGTAFEGSVGAHVETSFPPSLLAFHADAVDISGSGVGPRGSGLEAATLRLRLEDVDLLARTARSVSGTLEGVTLPASAAPTGFLVVPRIDLEGPAGAILAWATVPEEIVGPAVSTAIEREVGRAPDDVRLLAPDRIRVTMGPLRVEGRLIVRDGALRAALDVLPVEVTLIDASETSPLKLAGAAVSGSDLTLTGTLDPTALGLSPTGP